MFNFSLFFFNFFSLFFLSLIFLLFGRFFNKKGICFLFTSYLMGSLFILFYNNFVSSNSSLNVLFIFENWIKIKLFRIEWAFVYSAFNQTMLFVVNFITCCVVIYSYSYMKEDPHLIRYYGYISVFVLYMHILITANNYLTLFFGWEGVGICSYLLVNFWFTRINANKAAIKALLVNRIGDLALILGISLIYFLTGSCTFNNLLAIISFYTNIFIYFFNIKYNIILIISFFFLIGAIGKSAQIGLHTWLPDAMEGPTPISALIHAATMVTAGVLLIIKSALIFENTSSILLIMLFIGSLTAFFSATIGLLQMDIKKIIAYSTCSQLGYMIFVCGLSNYTISFFHLTNHAFFKALLFLCAGSIIHSMADEQDLRKFGGLISILTFTATCIFIGSITLAGLPFLSGFYSKDFILELSCSKYTLAGTAVYYIGITTLVLTCIYSYKIYYWCFGTCYLNNKIIIVTAKESTVITNFALLVLCLGSILIGWFNKDRFLGLGTNYFNSSIYVNIANNCVISAEFINSFWKIIPFFLLLTSLLLSVYFFKCNKTATNLLNKFNKFVSIKWGFDFVYNKLINEPLLTYAYNTNFLKLDKGFFDLFETKGLMWLFNQKNILINYKLTHTGIFFNYAGFLIFYLLFFLILFIS